MVLILRYLVPRGYTGISIFPFIVLCNKEQKSDVILINHERIHLRQQIELLVIPFYLWYIIEFLIKLCVYKNWNLAYKNISFEREAYANEFNLNYIKKRRIWSFLKYLRSK